MIPTGNDLASILDLPQVAPRKQTLLGSAPVEGPLASSTGIAKDESEIKFQMCCLLSALDVPVEAIAKKTGFPQVAIEHIQKSQAGSEHILRMQGALYPDPRMRIKKMVNLALDAKARILLTGTDVLKDKVATDILDRELGKSTQVTENRNVTVTGDVKTLDRALLAAEERLRKHEELEARLKSARSVMTIPIGDMLPAAPQR